MVALRVLLPLLALALLASPAQAPGGTGTPSPDEGAGLADTWVDFIVSRVAFIQDRVGEPEPPTPPGPEAVHPQDTLASADDALDPTQPGEPVQTPDPPIDHPPTWPSQVGPGEGASDPGGHASRLAGDLLDRIFAVRENCAPAFVSYHGPVAMVLALMTNDAPCGEDDATVARAPRPEDAPGRQAGQGSPRVPAATDEGWGLVRDEPLEPHAEATAAPAPKASPGTPAGTASLLLVTPTSQWPFLLLATGLALAALPLWRLYRRLARADALRQPMRRTIYELVRAEPGITTGGAARRLGVEHRTAQHHLRILHEFGLVEARSPGAWTRYYPSGSGLDDQARRLRVLLATPAARAVLQAAAQHPGGSMAQLARAAGVPKSTARFHLRRLAAAGALVDGKPRPDLLAPSPLAAAPAALAA